MVCCSLKLVNFWFDNKIASVRSGQNTIRPGWGGAIRFTFFSCPAKDNRSLQGWGAKNLARRSLIDSR